MTNYVKFAVLTKSKKWHGLCVSGINIDNGQFVRLVSDDQENHGTIYEWDFKYSNGRSIECLDIVKAAVLGHDGAQLQPENLLVDKTKTIEFVDHATIEEVISMHHCDIVDKIFANDAEYIDHEDWEKSNFGRSLLLLQVSNLKVFINSYGKTKANFIYEGEEYKNYSVTDFKYMDKELNINRAYLVVSVGVGFTHMITNKNVHYKLIAAIYPC